MSCTSLATGARHIQQRLVRAIGVYRMQNTLSAERMIVGTGLHSGALVRLKLLPAAPDTGITFRRVDCASEINEIPVNPGSWIEASLCTVLQNAHGVRVSTVEHLLAALHGCGVHNATIEIDGPEVPILDGSAAPFVAQILATGVRRQDAPLRVVRVLKPVEVARDGAVARLLPAPSLEIAFEIAFDDAAIGHQSKALAMRNGAFLRELSDCRTFCRRADVEAMQSRGLALGGTLDNAVVFDNGTVLSPGGLRRKDEPVRHKMLDAMGDLYVLGLPLIGRYEGVRAGHALTGRLLKSLLATPDAFEVITCDDQMRMRMPGVGISPRDLPLSA